MILRLLNPQGMVGLALSAALAILLVLQKSETRHWRKQSGQFEQLYKNEQSALAGTVANYRAAAAAARAADLEHARRVEADQRAISERTLDDYEARLAAARARADRLRVQAPAAAAHSGSRGGAAMSDLSAAAGAPDPAPAQDRLPHSDALIATEQAIQLDALIKWVKAQGAVTVEPPGSR